MARLATFKLTSTGKDETTVKAQSFKTVGDFIDFIDGIEAGGVDRVVLRCRASNVSTIERVDG